MRTVASKSMYQFPLSIYRRDTIGMKVQEFEESGLSFDEVVKQTEEYISSMNTFFVLETLDTLRKAGRLSNLKAFVASTLNIKPVMGSTDEGSIQQLGQARGIKRHLPRW